METTTSTNKYSKFKKCNRKIVVKISIMNNNQIPITIETPEWFRKIVILNRLIWLNLCKKITNSGKINKSMLPRALRTPVLMAINLVKNNNR